MTTLKQIRNTWLPKDGIAHSMKDIPKGAFLHFTASDYFGNTEYHWNTYGKGLTISSLAKATL